MGFTITEKILMAHAGVKSLTPGDFIHAKVDMALGNDITAPLAIKEFRSLGFKKVFDRNKIALVPDHFTPAKDRKSANQCKILKQFADEHRIKYYFELGRVGIEHALLPEQGVVMPGEVVIGADSHTCTYGAMGAFSTGVGSTDLAAVIATGRCWFRVPESMKFIYKGKLSRWVTGKDLILLTIGRIGVEGARYRSMEFTGPVIEKLPMDDRFAMCNMAIEAGGKNGIIAPDDITREYVEKTSAISGKKYKFYASDKDAVYSDTLEFDMTGVEPQIAAPDLPSNVDSVSKFKSVKVDQVVIGSCTNGRISDLREAAAILKKRKKAAGVRLIVIPGTQDIYKQAVAEGLVNTFIDAGGLFLEPTCGPCLGGHAGILAEGEVAIATTNRNFVGRMGHLKSKVYLSNPAVAAASAVKGKIANPQTI